MDGCDFGKMHFSTSKTMKKGNIVIFSYLIKDEVLITVGCPIFPPFYIDSQISVHRKFKNIDQYSIFGLEWFSNWRYDWRIVATKQQASKLPVCQHLSTDYVYHYYHGYSSRFLPMEGSRSKGIFTA